MSNITFCTRTVRATYLIRFLHIIFCTYIANYSIPPLTTVVVITSILHRNEELYPNPDEFSPDRFLDDDNKSKFLFGYLPFSAGARNCIGKPKPISLTPTFSS